MRRERVRGAATVHHFHVASFLKLRLSVIYRMQPVQYKQLTVLMMY